MQDIKEKLLTFLLATPEDEELLKKGKIPELFQQNKEAAIRLISLYGTFFCMMFLWLIMFSVSGFLFRLIFLFAAAGIAGFAAWKLGRETLQKALDFPSVGYPLAFTFAFGALYLLSDVFSQGGFFAVLTMLTVIGGLGVGIYKIRTTNLFQISNLTFGVASAAVIIFFSGLVLSCISLSEASQQARIEAWTAAKRAHQAQEMKQNMLTCTTEEECARLQMNKNKYYQTHEAAAQETCEYAVAAQVTTRFEWTVSPKTPKFSQYSIDVLKDVITLSGDKASLIEQDGTKKPFTYTCIYNTKTKTAKAQIQK